MIAVADPVGVGLAQSLARPGGNFTGITNIAAELVGKRLEIIKEILPSARHVAVLGNPDDPIFAVQLRYAEAASPSLQIELQPVLEVHRAEDNDAAFAAAVRAGAAAAIRFVDSMGFAETVAAVQEVDPKSFATGSERFDHEWLFGTHMMSAMGFGQVVLDHPEDRDLSLARMERSIDAMLRDDDRTFDEKAW